MSADTTSPPAGTLHLVAPELLGALDAIPAIALDDAMMAMIRGVDMTSAMTPPPLSPEQAAVRCEERRVPGLAGAPDVRVLVYTPPGDGVSPRPCYLHMHGGGFVLGVPEMNDGSNRGLAASLGCVVVSVDYRLAPETRWPGPVEDCLAALCWVAGEAAALGIDPARIAIGGESAGGGHAAALALLARDRGGPAIAFQLLDSPMLDDRTGTAGDPHPYTGEFVWNAPNNRYAWAALLGREPGGEDVPAEAVPGRRDDLAGLPPTLLVIGALDLFVEETIDYARRLIRAGVPTALHVIPGAFHGFALGGEAPQVVLANRLRNDALARAFAADPSSPR